MIGLLIYTLIIVYSLIAIYLYFNQHKLLYHPSNFDFYTCKEFEDTEKKELNGTRFFFKKNSDRLAIFYHGNQGSLKHLLFWKHIFEKLNLSYIIVEYAGFANDKKIPSKNLIFLDVKNVNKFIKKSNFSETIVIGESLGSGPASYHSLFVKPNKILLTMPFNRLNDVAQEKYPFFPTSFILKDKYDNISCLKTYDGLFRIIHGKDDITVPIHHSKDLYKDIKLAKKDFIIIKDATHDDIYEFEETKQAIEDYLS